MAQWDRTTPWRQGHLLTDEALRGAFSDIDDPDAIGVVVSHSCDLAQSPEVEPSVEIIVGRVIDAPNGNYSHAKNARTLHLAADAEQGAAVHFELSARNKRSMGKDRLAGYAPDTMRAIPPAELHILQRWLAARYRRSTFPDEFDRRLSDSGMPGKLSKILTPLGRDIVCLFFDVDEGQEKERNGEIDTYLLIVSVLYTEKNNIKASEVAEHAASKIRALFKSKFWDPAKNSWKWIELDLVDCLSTEALSYEASLRLRKWNADHISLRSDEDQPILE